MSSREAQATIRAEPNDGANPYHWFDLPNGETIRGFWDLRETWRDYLGGFDFAGKSVLELGPASGFLSLQMEKAGAKVTSFDIPEGATIDLLPIPGVDMEALARQQMANIDIFRRAWRHYHAAFQSRNQTLYGDIYRLSEIGRRFDVTTVAAILLHLENPFRALREAAKITDDAIIVTDIQNPRFPNDQPFIEFNPSEEGGKGAGWWLLSSGAVSRMLTAIGFSDQKLSYSTHRLYNSPFEGATFSDIGFFTIVARRPTDP